MENSTQVTDAAMERVKEAREETQMIEGGVTAPAGATGGQPGGGAAGVRERMDVIASCGKKVGVVDHVEGRAIKLTKKDSPDGLHHFVPVDWIDHVDSHVHLRMNSQETEQNWKTDAAACGC